MVILQNEIQVVSMEIFKQDKYSSLEWKQKRNEILIRDNFHCQNESCKNFDPSKGIVQIKNGDDLEFHEYKSDPGESLYILTSSQKDITINLDFYTDWLVLPVMQVHHKRYIENRNLWEYDNADLITLCKVCHTTLHFQREIEFYDSNEKFIERKKCLPKDLESDHKHGFPPWVFIHLNSQKAYELSENVKPNLSLVLFEEEKSRKEEITKEAQGMYEDFFKRFLPNYYK